MARMCLSRSGPSSLTAKAVLGVDIGGTKIAVGIVDRSGKILEGVRSNLCWRSVAQSVRFRRAAERACFFAVIERPHADVIARTEQLLLRAVPKREREIAEQPAGTRRGPLTKGEGDDLGVGGALGDLEAGRA